MYSLVYRGEYYAKLFSLIGTAYGAGDGSTTFNLPTKEGLASVGIKSNDSDFNAIGKTGGSKTNAFTLNGTADFDISGDTMSFRYKGSNSWTSNWSKNISIGSNQSNKNLTSGVQLSGSTNSGSILQPFTVTNYIIKVSETRPLTGAIVNQQSNSDVNTYSCDYINNRNTYSTNEVFTGKHWIDGKPIYRRVIIHNALDTTTRVATETIAPNSTLSNAWCVGGYVYYATNGYTYPIDSNIGCTVQVSAGYNSITLINNNSNSRTLDFYVFIEYTKTTD